MQNEPIIQVGILLSDRVEFSFNGDFHDKHGNHFTGLHQVFVENDKIIFNNRRMSELEFSPTSVASYFDLYNVVIGINFHWERKENQRFKGALKLILEQGQIRAINLVKVEDYLTSVISSEMSATASAELLKAHAVISRSWLLYPLQEQRTKSKEQRLEIINSQLSTVNYIKWYERDAHTHFDVCADDHCQRYQGITRASTAAVQAAIAATQGQVLMYENDICDARFSKCCGGATETFENCWENRHHPYLTKVIDNFTFPKNFQSDLTIEKNAQQWIRESPTAYCNTADKKILAQVLNNYDQETTDFYRWKVTYTQAELAELLKQRSGIDFGQIIDLIPLKRGESGRIVELKIVSTLREIVVGKELEIRKWLSSSHLYSSAFVVDRYEIMHGIPQKFVLSGAGWGHGVGLCQIGAAMMGEQGFCYEAILKHYFQNSELKKIY